MRDLLGRTPASVAVIVGPEGGWTAEERDQMIAAGCTPVTLGALTLRADAVPLVAIAMARFALADL
jgi:16S rRNA (uracil1498-N3)-methyltransferase